MKFTSDSKLNVKIVKKRLVPTFILVLTNRNQPGPTGQLGNGIADNLAKLGAEYADEGLEPRLPIFTKKICLSSQFQFT